MLRKLLTLSEKTLDVSFLAARPDSVVLVADRSVYRLDKKILDGEENTSLTVSWLLVILNH